MKIAPKISVIIPVYNVEEYLRDCLDTLINQTMKDIEFICINDGSTDGSLNILNEYASNDDRFVIITQKNQGQGIARNKGIELAKGEYISFVDPDDWVELDIFEILYNKFRETEVDVIQFDYDNCYGMKKCSRAKSYKTRLKKDFNYTINDNDIYSWKDIPKKRICGMSLCIWDKAYRTDFIRKNNINLAPNKHGEDHIFSISANLLANKILYVGKFLYHYRIRSGAASNKITDGNFSIFDNVERIKNFLISKKLYGKYERSFSEYRLTAFSWHYNGISEQSQKKYLERCSEMLQDEEYKEFLKRLKGEFSFIEKIFSIRNKRINSKKYKIVTVLGTHFKVKPYKENNEQQ